MATLKFKHEDKNYTVKGAWEKDTFTAQAYIGKKTVSEPFVLTREKPKDGVLADNSALESAVLEAAKNDVITGGYNPS